MAQWEHVWYVFQGAIFILFDLGFFQNNPKHGRLIGLFGLGLHEQDFTSYYFMVEIFQEGDFNYKRR